MAIDRVNAVLIGQVKDKEGFPAELLEDPDTGARMLAYDVDTWWERGRYLQEREAMAKRRRPKGTPRNAWPARPP